MKRAWSIGVFVLANWGVVANGWGSVSDRGLQTVVSVYESGSQPASSVVITRELECSFNDAQACGRNGNNGVDVATNCTNYDSGWDTSGSIREAFGSHPYLVVEEYDPSTRYCGDGDGVINATAYLVDEKCHTSRDGAASTKITLGRSLTIAQYSDPVCGRVESEAEVPFGDYYDRACSNNATRYLYNGPTPPMSAVAVYKDSSCSQAPVKLTAERDPWIGGCRPDGNSHYSVSSCTSDYNELAAAVFGDETPYAVVEEYLRDYCAGGRANSATVYIMDNACHTNPEDASS